MLSGIPRAMLRFIGILMCLASVIWGYFEHQSATMLFGPLVGFLTGASIIITTFEATDAILRKLISMSTSEDGRAVRDAHNRQAMLNRVRDFWVKGVLESSLHEEVRIELGFAEQRDAVAEHPWDVILRTADRPDCVLPPGTKISDVFERVGRSLLILGEPGAGKTTTLLELAREMIDRAEKDPTEKIPVVFNLSSWIDPKQTISDWLEEELRAKYNIPKKIATPWVENDSLLLLLDGLDEVASVRRAECVEAINGYLGEHLVPVAVCCRKEEYEALDVKLKLQSAVLLQPLTPEQIDGYLERLSPDLNALRVALRSDRELQEFAQTPLILSIMTLAYRGMPIEELQSLGSIEDRRRHLFKTYVDQMFKRTTRIDPELYPKEKTIHWLSWLARKMSEHNQSEFLIERMQPSWLETKTKMRLYSVFIGLICGLIGGIIFGVIFGLNVGLCAGLIIGLIFGLMFGMEESKIKPAEALNWSWKERSKELILHRIVDLIIGLSVGLIFGLIIGFLFYAVFFLIFGLVFGPIFKLSDEHLFGLISALGFALGFALVFGLVFGLIGRPIVEEMDARVVTNQGIKKSVKNALVVGLFSGLISGYIGGMMFGLMFLLMFGLMFGGMTVIKHFTLRILLCCRDFLPWNLVLFLDYATERIFMRKVGGGYVFVHRMLMEYFASLEPGPGVR